MRAFGPYKIESKTTTRWRVIVRKKGHKDEARAFDTEQQSRAELRRVNAAAAALAAPTVEQAAEVYRGYLVEKGLRPATLERTSQQLAMFFEGHTGRPVTVFSPSLGEKLYEALRRRTTPRGERIAADSQLNVLGVSKTFVRWLVKRRIIRTDFLADVEPLGKRKKGKPQMTTDEGRRWLAKAFELSDMGDIGATAAATALLTGLRAGEVVGRAVRDLDDGGAVLSVTTSKTETGIRRQEVPEALRFRLLRLAADRPPDALLFGGRPPKTQGRKRRRTCRPLEQAKDTTKWLLVHVHRVSDLAGVRRVCSHPLRGQHGSEARRAGITGNAVAATLGHVSFTTTRAHYLPRARCRGGSADETGRGRPASRCN